MSDVSLTVRLVDRLSPLARRVAEAVQGIGSSFRAAGGDATAANARFERVDKTLQRLAHASLAMQGLGRAAAAMRQRLGAVITGTADFDDMMQGLAQTAGLSAKRQAELRREIIGVANTFGYLPAAIAEHTIGQFIQAGASEKTASAMMALTAKVARATRADLKDIGNTSIALNQNLNVLPEHMEEVLDGMHQAGKEGRFELKDMAAHFARTAALAQQFGMTGKKAALEIAAAMEVARMATGDASQAATNVENLFQKLVSPQTVKKFQEYGVDIKEAIAQGTKQGRSPLDTVIVEAKKVLAGSGASIDEVFSSDRYLKLLRSNDTTKVFKDFGIDINKKIRWGLAHGHSVQETLKHWGEKLISSARGKKQGLTWEKLFPDLPKNVAIVDLFQDQQAMLAMAALIQHYDEFQRIREKAMSSKDVIATDFAAMTATTKARLDRLNAASKGLGLTWGDVLAPAAAFAADMIAALTNGLRGMMDSFPLLGAIGGGIAGAVVAIGTAATNVSTALVGLAATTALLNGTAAGAAIGGVFAGLGRVVAAIAAGLLGIPGLAAAAVAGLTAMFIAYDGDMVEGFRDLGRRAALGLWEGLRRIAELVPSLPGQLMGQLTAAFSGLKWPSLAGSIDLSGVGRGVVEALQRAILAVPIVGWAATVGREFGTTLAQQIAQALQGVNLVEAGKALIQSLREGMKSAAAGLLGWVGSLGSSIANKIRGMIPGGGASAPAAPAPEGAQPSSTASPERHSSLNLIGPRAGASDEQITRLASAVEALARSRPDFQQHVTQHIQGGNAKDTADEAVRQLARRRQAGMWDGALA
jgi:TP901 family phage tail tape measure protein